ncbi:MAG: hypothetical protein IH855_05365 [Bacteroidetes bacterium]|nr:hypothetical protein [Bacteroidota bacterium]
MRHTAKSQYRTSSPIKAGTLAGLGGGVIFGMMMGMMGMLPMVAGMVGSSSALIGLILHLGISAFIGASYGLVASRLPARTSVHVTAGMANGVVWWVLGALIMMPLALGMNEMVLTIGQPQVMSLIGHLVFGLVTAYVFNRLYGRA